MAGAVTCVGSNMTDMITYCERAPGPGETIIGSRMVLGFGGKGANQAVMSRFLGSSVAIVTCVGDDANGAAYKRRLEEVGVDVAHVHTTRQRALASALPPAHVARGSAQEPLRPHSPLVHAHGTARINRSLFQPCFQRGPALRQGRRRGA